MVKQPTTRNRNYKDADAGNLQKRQDLFVVLEIEKMQLKIINNFIKSKSKKVYLFLILTFFTLVFLPLVHSDLDTNLICGGDGVNKY